MELFNVDHLHEMTSEQRAVADRFRDLASFLAQHHMNSQMRKSLKQLLTARDHALHALNAFP